MQRIATSPARPRRTRARSTPTRGVVGSYEANEFGPARLIG